MSRVRPVFGYLVPLNARNEQTVPTKHRLPRSEPRWQVARLDVDVSALHDGVHQDSCIDAWSSVPGDAGSLTMRLTRSPG